MNDKQLANVEKQLQAAVDAAYETDTMNDKQNTKVCVWQCKYCLAGNFGECSKVLDDRLNSAMEVMMDRERRRQQKIERLTTAWEKTQEKNST